MVKMSEKGRWRSRLRSHRGGMLDGVAERGNLDGWRGRTDGGIGAIISMEEGVSVLLDDGAIGHGSDLDDGDDS